MAKNRIEKQRGALRGLGIAALAFGLLGLGGGAVMVVFGAINLSKGQLKAGLRL